MKRKENIKPTLDDVATLAGVSSATVDRVLNERGGVAPSTAAKVLDAAKSLGIKRILPSPYSRLFRIRFIMPRSQSPVFERLKSAFEREIAAASNSLILDRIWINLDDPRTISKAFEVEGVDAIIAFVPENSAAIEAISDVTSAGVPVVTLCSDLPTSPRLAYVGIDHYKAGRAAGFFMGTMVRSNNFVAVCSDTTYRAEAARIAGFRDALTEVLSERPQIRIIEGDEWCQTPPQNDVAGLYLAGWNGLLTEYLGRWNVDTSIVIAHDLGATEQSLLKDGKITIAIDQNPEEQARKSIALLMERMGIESDYSKGSAVPFSIQTQHNT